MKLVRSIVFVGLWVIAGCATAVDEGAIVNSEGPHNDASTTRPSADGGGVDAAHDSGVSPTKIPDSSVSSNDTSTNPPPSDSSVGPDTSPANTCVTSPPSNTCGVDPQCGCATGNTCEVDQTALDGTSSCVAAGTSGIGQTCTATANQCQQGLTCVFGACRPYCETDSTACTETGTGQCFQLATGNTPVPNLLVCEVNCAIDDAKACGGSGNGCIYLDTDRTDCSAVGTSSTCSASQLDCKPGYTCVDVSGSYGCEKSCVVGGSGCPKNLTCLGFNIPRVVHGVEYGICD